MPKENPLNSGNPNQAGISSLYGNPERIRWEQRKRATTHSADRTPAVWVCYGINTVGWWASPLQGIV